MVVCGSVKFYDNYRTAIWQLLRKTPANLLRLTRGLCFQKSIFADYFIHYELYCNYTVIALVPI